MGETAEMAHLSCPSVEIVERKTGKRKGKALVFWSDCNIVTLMCHWLIPFAHLCFARVLMFLWTNHDGPRWRWNGGISGAIGVGAAPSLGTAPGHRAACARQARVAGQLSGSRAGPAADGRRRHSGPRPRSAGGPASGAPTSAHVRAEPLALPPSAVPLSRRSCSLRVPRWAPAAAAPARPGPQPALLPDSRAARRWRRSNSSSSAAASSFPPHAGLR